MKNNILKEAKRRRIQSILFIAIPLFGLIWFLFSLLTRIGILPNEITFFISPIFSAMLFIFAVALAISCRGVLSIMGGILLAILMFIDTAIAIINSITVSLFQSGVETEILIGILSVSNIVYTVIALFIMIAYALLASGTKFSILFRLTIIAYGVINFIFTVISILVPVASGTTHTDLTFLNDTLYIMRQAINLLTAAVCIVEFSIANKQIKTLRAQQ